MTSQQILDPAAAATAASSVSGAGGSSAPGVGGVDGVGLVRAGSDGVGVGAGSSRRRGWDPTPEEAAVTARLLQMRRMADQAIAQLQASQSVIDGLLLQVAQGQQARAKGVPVGQTREGVPVFEADDAAVRAMQSEISAACHESRRAVQTDLSEAWMLHHQFPQVEAAHGRGEVDADRGLGDARRRCSPHGR